MLNLQRKVHHKRMSPDKFWVGLSDTQVFVRVFFSPRLFGFMFIRWISTKYNCVFLVFRGFGEMILLQVLSNIWNDQGQGKTGRKFTDKLCETFYTVTSALCVKCHRFIDGMSHWNLLMKLSPSVQFSSFGLFMSEWEIHTLRLMMFFAGLYSIYPYFKSSLLLLSLKCATPPYFLFSNYNSYIQ